MGNADRTAKGARSASAAVCAALALLGGCGRDESHERAVRDGARELAALAGSGQWSSLEASANRRAAKLQEELAALRAASGSQIAGEAGGANLLLAEGEASLAQVAARQAQEGEAQALGRIGGLRDALEVWTFQHALARSLVQYDPTGDLAALDQQIAERDRQIGEANARKRANEDAVAQLRAQAGERLESAKARRNEAGLLRQRAMDMTATAGEPLVVQAREIGRQADALDVEASTLAAEAARQAPASFEIQSEIDRLLSQRELLEASKRSIAQRVASDAALAQESQATAAAAGERLVRLVDELAALRTERVVPRSDAAEKGFGNAVSLARKAGQGGVKGGTAPIVGSMQHALADTLAARAQGLRAYADILAQVAGVEPPLPDAARLRTLAGETDAAAKAAAEAARAAYEEAASSYGNAGGGEEGPFGVLAARMRALGEGRVYTGAPARTPDDAPAGGGDEGGALATPASGSPEEQIRVVLARFLEAAKAGDQPAMLDLMYIEDASIRETLTALAQAGAALDAAFRSAYGKSVAEAAGVGGAGAGVPGVNNPAFGAVTAESFTIEVDEGGESGAATPRSAVPGLESMPLVLVDGRWLVAFDLPPAVAPMFAAARPLADVIEAVAGEVESGAYPTAEEAIRALNERMMGVTGVGGGATPPGGG